jgi:hypothetical protein
LRFVGIEHLAVKDRLGYGLAGPNHLKEEQNMKRIRRPAKMKALESHRMLQFYSPEPAKQEAASGLLSIGTLVDDSLVEGTRIGKSCDSKTPKLEFERENYHNDDCL